MSSSRCNRSAGLLDGHMKLILATATAMALLAVWGPRPAWALEHQAQPGTTDLPRSAPADEAAQQVDIILRGAMARADSPERKDLFLSTTVRDGAYGWVLGVSPDHNRGMHRARVVEGGPERGRMTIELVAQGDPWVPGGVGRYTIIFPADARTSLARGGEDGRVSVEGTYTGVFNGLAVSGGASYALASPLSPEAGYVAPGRDEHPRMLVRRSGIPALRARAKTPLGRALVERIAAQRDDPVSLGMMYILTDDPAYARRAQPIVQRMMDDETPGAFNGSDGAYARRVGRIAMAYDLCYQGWDEAFRERVTRRLAARTKRMLFRPDTITRKVNWAPNSNYSGHLNGASAIAGLCIYDKPSPRPAPPRDPGDEPRIISPDAALSSSVPQGVPVVGYQPGTAPDRWLMAGPFPNPDDRDDDPFKGGQAGVRAKPGDQVRMNGQAHAWAALPPSGVWVEGSQVRLALELMGATNKAYNTTSFFYTVIDVPARVTVQFRSGQTDRTHAFFFVSSQPVYDGDFVTLEPGRHPLLVRAQLDKVNPWGKSGYRPRFETVTDAEVRAGLVKANVEYEAAMGLYREDLAYWQASDGASPLYRWLQLCGERKATWYHRYCFGDGGFQVEGEGYTAVGSDEPVLFETFYRNQFGRPTTGRPDVSHFGPRYIAQTIYDEDGVFEHQSFSLTDGSLSPRRWALAFPPIPDAWKPAALWAWNTTMGVPQGGLSASQSSADRRGRSAAERGQDDQFIAAVARGGNDAVFTFLHYPMDLQPQHPEGVIPRVWQAKTKGLYVFRNGWSGRDDIVAQLFLKSEGEGGWANEDGGSFRLAGLGHVWTSRGGNTKARKRVDETVVILPELEHNAGMRAIMTDFVAKADGSGSVAADMDLIYATRVRSADGGAPPLVNNMFEVNKENIAPTGVTGRRILGVDYSGRCGAPGLFVLIDDIRGRGGPKVWQWQLPGGVAHKDVSITDDGFVLRRGKATLRATFVSSAPVSVRFANPKPDEAQPRRGGRPVHPGAMLVTNQDPTVGRFHVILTLQQGAAPPVTVGEHRGLDTTVTVGDQRVRLAGERVVFGR